MADSCGFTAKGTLVLIGGALDTTGEMAILRRIWQETGIAAPSVEVITSPTEHPLKCIREHRPAFQRAAFGSVGCMRISHREQADKPGYIQRIRSSNAVFLPGGDQKRLVGMIGDTGIHRALLQRFQEDADFILAATSAGAAAMSRLMVAGYRAMPQSGRMEHYMRKGLGFLPYALVTDTHLDRGSGRYGRIEAMAGQHRDRLVVGLCENTAGIIKGQMLECVGEGSIRIINARAKGTADEVCDLYPGGFYDLAARKAYPMLLQDAA